MSAFHVRPLIEGTILPMLFEAVPGEARPLGEAPPAVRDTQEQHLPPGGRLLSHGLPLDGAAALRNLHPDICHPPLP